MKRTEIRTMAFNKPEMSLLARALLAWFDANPNPCYAEFEMYRDIREEINNALKENDNEKD